MKVKMIAQLVSVTKKTGKNGEYVSVVMIQDGEVIDAYSKNVQLQQNLQDKEYTVEMKKYKGQYSSIRIM